ncbi:MAG: hypothetical protein C0480_12210 [Bradyrhizobium sp.]|jgi:hypothetical protein|nr:hypothetical protein [Bradyrhizobium sp.]
MEKSLSALAMFCLLGASLMAVPGFAPKVEAGEVAVLAKADRLDVRAAVSNCSTQVWPYFAQSCLRSPDSGVKILEARLVTARR